MTPHPSRAAGELVVCLSGGKDSTAMALHLAETEPADYSYLCTPTGDELPEMQAHWDRLEVLLGKPLTRITNGTLDSWIEEYGALPNWRQRWCTRLLKIEPLLAWIKGRDVLLHVGLRADEEERRGIISNDVSCRFPLREWGWGINEVRVYLRERGVAIPARTDCARCYGQRLHEWFALWRKHPDIFAQAEAQEATTGKTFRSPGRDTWPAGLTALRESFAAGRIPRGAVTLFDDDAPVACRVCSL